MELLSFRGDSSLSSFFDPLDIQFDFIVHAPVCSPIWRVKYLADVASERATVLLAEWRGGTCTRSTKSSSAMHLSSSSATPAASADVHEGTEVIATLYPGGLYSLDVKVSNMKEKLSEIKVKYLQQVSVVQIELFDDNGKVDEQEPLNTEGTKLVSSVQIVSQGIRPSKSSDLSTWLRRIYSPLS